jgi:hypothetical protein
MQVAKQPTYLGLDRGALGDMPLSSFLIERPSTVRAWHQAGIWGAGCHGWQRTTHTRAPYVHSIGRGKWGEVGHY